MNAVFHTSDAAASGARGSARGRCEAAGPLNNHRIVSPTAIMSDTPIQSIRLHHRRSSGQW